MDAYLKNWVLPLYLVKYVGIDVDDTQYHGSAFNKDTGEALDFKCRPTLKVSAEPVG
jgi:hypothetical protein